jgi:hypothetical protein
VKRERRTYELLDDCFPGDETLDDNVTRAEVVAVNVLPDESLGAGHCGLTGARGADGGRAREGFRLSCLVVRHGGWSNSVVFVGSSLKGTADVKPRQVWHCLPTASNPSQPKKRPCTRLLNDAPAVVVPPCLTATLWSYCGYWRKRNSFNLEGIVL